MNTRQVKMKMLAKVLKNISSVLFWIVAVVFSIFLLASIVMLFIPEKNLVLPATLSGTITASMDGIFKFNIGPQPGGELMIKPFLQAMFIWISVISLMLSITLFEIKRILKTVVKDNPFEKENSKNLTVIAVTLISGSFLVKFLEGLVATAAIQALKIANIDITYSIDWTLLATGILLLILAGVFQYGSYLQEEVDSTL
jgi:hypothetical protein